MQRAEQCKEMNKIKKNIRIFLYLVSAIVVAACNCNAEGLDNNLAQTPLGANCVATINFIVPSTTNVDPICDVIGSTLLFLLQLTLTL